MSTRQRLALAAELGILAATTVSFAGNLQTYSLDSDFIDEANPSGVWSYRHDARLLPHVDSWQSVIGGWSEPQPGWAESENGNNRLPFVFRSNGSETFGHDWPKGAIVGHSTDPANGVGNGVMTIVFTVPLSGRVDVSGSTWLGRDIGRANDWRVIYRGEVLASGTTSSGDEYSSANPFLFVDGEATPGSLSELEVCAGEELLLEVEKRPEQVAGEFSVVSMTIEYTSLFPDCPADLSGDCKIDGADIGVLLGGWGGKGAGDLDGNGTIDGGDLGLLLSQWGPCPQS